MQNKYSQATHREIALIGCGRWGKNILRDLLSLGCNVHVAEHSEAGREHAISMGAYSVSRDETGLPASVDGYIVAVQTSRHQEILEGLAPSEKPIFVEKPMVPNMEAAHALNERMGNRVFVMHKWRYHPGIQRLADLHTSGEYGNLVRLSTQRLQWGQPHKDVDAAWILLPHDVSIVLHILKNLPLIKAVQANVMDGAIHAITALLGNTPAVQIEVSALYPAEVKRMVSAQFENAVVSLTDPLSDHLDVRHLDGAGRPTGVTEHIPISTEYPLLRELDAFVGYLNGGEQPMSCVDDEIKVMKHLDALRTAAFAANQ